MKRILLFLFIAVAGCGGKTHEDIAQELITKRIKDSLPPDTKYEALNYGTMGKAFLAYEETSQYARNTSSLQQLKDSLELLKKTETNNAAPAKEQIARLTHNIEAINDSIQSGKRAYVPEQIFKMSHAYKITDPSGVTKTKEDAYYIDAQFTRIIKVQKIY